MDIEVDRMAKRSPATGSSVSARGHDASCRASLYRDAIFGEAPRVLGLMDREEMSPTCGCMDRTYWAWKFTDFAGSRFQEGICTLAFLYTYDCKSRPYFGNGRFLQWIGAGVRYWMAIQRRSGDFDEAYPFERSLAATAFTTFYLSEAYRLSGEAWDASLVDEFKGAVGRACEWLLQNDERHGFLSNHLAAAAGALLHGYLICGDERFHRRYRYFLGRILKHQSSEGWYEEYGGADPGYQTHGAYYLARCYALEPDDELRDSLDRSFRFLQHFVHPDGSLGGEYASRNTQTYYPAAVEMAARYSGAAHWIAERMADSVRDLRAVGLRAIDIYNYFPLLNNYVFALLAAESFDEGTRVPAKAPEQREAVWNFADAGIVKVSTPSWEVFVGTKKGGVVKAFSRETGNVSDDCGFLGRDGKGGWVSSQWFSQDWSISVTDREIVVEGSLVRVGKPLMTPWRFVAFRLFSLTIGRIGRVAYWLKGLLVRALIYRSKKLDIRFRRTIQVTNEQIVIQDRMVGPDGKRLAILRHVATFATIHMGSSRYFVPHQLDAGRMEPADNKTSNVDTLAIADGVTLERRICHS